LRDVFVGGVFAMFLLALIGTMSAEFLAFLLPPMKIGEKALDELWPIPVAAVTSPSPR